MEFLKDGTIFTEVYDAEGSLITSGTASEISKELGMTVDGVRWRARLQKEGHSFRDGIDFVDVGVLRFVYDLRMNGSFVGQGSLDELSDLTGMNVNNLRCLSTPSYHRRVAKRSKDSESPILFRHDEPRIDYY